jgi:hypothetical protein
MVISKAVAAVLGEIVEHHGTAIAKLSGSALARTPVDAGRSEIAVPLLHACLVLKSHQRNTKALSGALLFVILALWSGIKL